MSQNDLILRHLREVGPLTQLEALGRYRVARLASRINDLRKRGHAIHTELVSSSAGAFGRHAKYVLLTEPF